MNKKAKAILCTASIVGVISVAGVMAYLTDTDTATNTLTTGQVEIDLQEPLWDAADSTTHQNLAPNAVVTKDPQVKNTGKNSAYIYLKVTVPVKKVKTANADGTLKNNGAAADTQLFTYELAENSKWNEITSKRQTNVNSTTNEVESYTYVYYYNEAVAPNATTDKLFTQVKYANVIEGQNDNSTEEIDIKAYAIQSDSLPANTTIAGAYDIYVAQNAD
jgi:alternate signal-mediated exported protein